MYSFEYILKRNIVMGVQNFNQNSNLFREVIKRILLEGQNKNLALSYVNKLKPEKNSEVVISNILSNCPASVLSNNKWLPVICKLYLEDNISLSKLNTLFKDVDKYQNTSSIVSLNLTTDYKNANYDTIKNAITKYVDRANNKIKKKQEISQATAVNNYKIIPLLTFEDAQKYKSLASWCICSDKKRFESSDYTENKKDKWYLLINQNTVNKYNHNDQEKGKYGNSNKEYAYSAIIVNINSDGDLHYGVTRYNDGNNQIGENKLSELLGQDYHNVLKPYTKEEEEKIKKENEKPFKLAQQRLDNGDNPKDVFDFVYNFSDGFAKVLLNNKYNFINTKGKILSQQWFDEAYPFFGDFAKVELGGEYSFIDREGKILSQQWFDKAYPFSDGFAKVILNWKYNFIDKEGKIISQQWFDKAYPFSDGFARIKLNDKWNFINTKGKIIFQQWFDWIDSFFDGFAKVLLNNKYNFINTKGKILSQQWFDEAYSFFDDFTKVELGGEYNFIDKKGKLISQQWFEFVGNFHEGYVSVSKRNGMWNFMDERGHLLTDTWFLWAGIFNNGFAPISGGIGQYNFIDKKGKLVSDVWFDEVGSFSPRKNNKIEAYVRVRDNWYMLDTDGNLHQKKED